MSERVKEGGVCDRTRGEPGGCTELSSLSSNCLLIDLLIHSNIYLNIAACNEIIKLSNSGSCNVFVASCDIQLFFVS